MNETLSPAPDGIDSEIANKSHEQFIANLDSFEESLPEIADRKEAILKAGQEIIDEFGVSPELFADSARALVFIAIAAEYSKIDETDSYSDGLSKKEYIADITFLLAKNYTPEDSFADLKKEVESEQNPGNLSEEAEIALYDKYTDKELSRELREAIDNGLLDKYKQKLGITAENEDDFTVRVMSFASEAESSGIRGTTYNGNQDSRYMSDAEIQELQDHNAELAIEFEWKQGLARRREEFFNVVGAELRAMAWVTRIGDQTFLCINAAAAEKILHEETTSLSTTYDSNDRERDIATLGHEYIHTQGGLLVDYGIDFGMALEERRAEYFSGDKNGYIDVKNTLQDLRITTGFSVLDFFDSQETKGGDRATLYTELAKNLGMRNMLELLLALPYPYADEQANSVSLNVQKVLGGMDVISDRLYEETIVAGEEAQMNERAINFASLIAAGIKDKEMLDTYLHMRKGGKKTSNLIGQKLKEMQHV